MRTLRVLVIAAATAALITACSGSHPKTTAQPTGSAVAVTSPASSLPQRCPAIMNAVGDVARKANISLVAGSMSGTVTRTEELDWSAELRNADRPVPSPSAADVKVREDTLTASFEAVMGGNAGARKFIAGLQKVQTDCS